jgi:hypothetical protein
MIKFKHKVVDLDENHNFHIKFILFEFIKKL